MDATDGLPPRERRWAVFSLALAISLVVVDMALSNVALPTIARDLGVSPSSSIWIVNAYQVAVTVSLLPLAALGDIIGYRRIYVGGLILFTACALISATADSLPVLVASRLVQGFGAAGVMSVNTALVRFVYPRAKLGQGVGMNSLVVATASAAGPTIAAAVLSFTTWPWLFAIAIPFGLTALLFAVLFLPGGSGSGHRFDILSAVLSVATLGLLLAAVDGLAHGGGVLVLLPLGGSALAGWLFVRRQRGLPMPMLPVELFARPAFSLSVATAIAAYMAQSLAIVSLPFYFIAVAGRTQVEAGLLMTAWPIAVAAVAPFSGRLADRYPVGLLAGIGLAAMASGLFLLAMLPPSPTAADVAWRMAICGLGFGFFQAPNNRAILASVPRERSGAAGGVLSTSRLLGQTSGAALVAVIFGIVGTQPGAGHGAVVALAVGSCCAGLAALVSLTRLGGFARRGE
ncbi:DHA2 family multidrug resistance protein-like MFS transporter [Stella humosa]|uniref:DHA2 family multidrug resistance protein-like MFS transporter n=1 Tax=Stella humosa TaxID=94 RepID=A0A3N1L7V0_9PROT|nr:MFS transporter [Stella humosa]ROP90743.1 DHA2 family multidrug resistance protein-like MFS transporter [Stella humosa]BBK34912.1 MFS transporter [Stella humosa]